MGKILLFYKYTHFDYPGRIKKWQLKVGQDLNLTGRIIVAHEGINATVGGSDAAIERYKQILLKHPQLTDMDIKESVGNADCFPRLRVVVKQEIVHLGITGKASIENTGIHLTPAQTHELLTEKPEDLVILDARNAFEAAIGAFEGAVKPEIAHFRDLPAYIDNNLEQFKDKQVLMYCTGGIRCERATAYLNEKNVAKKVYQIEGGIQRYAEQFPDGYFRGKNYVFDGRLAVRVNDDVLSNCSLCPKACDEYNNCLNASCNKHYIACTDCLKEYDQCCSVMCQELVSAHKVPLRAPYKKVSAEAMQ